VGEAEDGPAVDPTPQRPVRLFVAVDPPEHARDAVASAIAPWRGSIPEARWIDRTAWHVTLKFLGPTAPGLIGSVRDLIARAAAEVVPFEAGLGGLGAFPLRGPARVLWAGVDDRSGRLAGLALAVDAALAPLAEAERRPLHPHLTVARLHPARRVPEAFAATEVETVTFTVDRVCLYRSHLGGGPVRYERLAAAQLGTL
jgi:2'-5' RNA ligase